MEQGFGAFGKIPSLGDFFRIDLPRSFVESWDAWLQSGIMTARTTLDGNWDAVYMSAPIWRFSMPAGHAGPQAMSGILMASVDRVGRQFPLTFAAPFLNDDVPAHHFANTATFEKLELLALRSLDDSMTREGIQDGLSEISFETPKNVTAQTVGNAQVWRAAVPPMHVLGVKSIANHQRNKGYWSMALEHDHRVMACNSLPVSGQFNALFNPDGAMWGNVEAGDLS